MQHIFYPPSGSGSSGGATEATLQVVANRVFGTLLSGITWNYFSVEYPTTTQEVFKYYSGGSGGTLLRTVTINYTDSNKTDILNGGWS